MIAQLFLGLAHHRIYKRTHSPTILASTHVWLGRVLILAAIVNGFLGFLLAQNSKFNWLLLAFVVVIALITIATVFWRRRKHSQAKAGLVESSLSLRGL